MMIPHFEHYSAYIWGAYGVAMGAVLVMVIVVLCAHARAVRESDDA